MKTIGRYYLYPFLWLWMLTCIAFVHYFPEQLALALATKAVVTVGLLLLFEWKVPLDDRWGMTKQHFLRRDLPMIIVNSISIAAINYGLVLLSVATATSADGLMAGQPLLLQIVFGLLIFEGLQYSVHRLMHRDEGAISSFLWRCHAIHHLPQQVYVVMHAVFHPVNAVFVRLLVQLLPIWLLGFDEFAVFVYGSIIALHGTVSHLNVDMRLGPLNYVFVGPELHRYHHSARAAESSNYGAAISLFDLLFGTFLYRPEQQPQSLGLYEGDGYPAQHAPLQALLFPFRSEHKQVHTVPQDPVA